MDNSVVIAGGIMGLHDNGKTIIKIRFLKRNKIKIT